jgi:hypothetical protein
LLVTANAALDKRQQKSANADRAVLAGQQSRSQAEAMCQLFNWASDSFEDALASEGSAATAVNSCCAVEWATNGRLKTHECTINKTQDRKN